MVRVNKALQIYNLSFVIIAGLLACFAASSVSFASDGDVKWEPLGKPLLNYVKEYCVRACTRDFRTNGVAMVLDTSKNIAVGTASNGHHAKVGCPCKDPKSTKNAMLWDQTVGGDRFPIGEACKAKCDTPTTKYLKEMKPFSSINDVPTCGCQIKMAALKAQKQASEKTAGAAKQAIQVARDALIAAYMTSDAAIKALSDATKAETVSSAEENTLTKELEELYAKFDAADKVCQEFLGKENSGISWKDANTAYEDKLAAQKMIEMKKPALQKAVDDDNLADQALENAQKKMDQASIDYDKASAVIKTAGDLSGSADAAAKADYETLIARQTELAAKRQKNEEEKLRIATKHKKTRELALLRRVKSAQAKTKADKGKNDGATIAERKPRKK